MSALQPKAPYLRRRGSQSRNKIGYGVFDNYALLVSFIAAFCLLGCSKGGASGKVKGLVPETAAEVMASPDYKQVFTTKNGTKLYIRPLTEETANAIPSGSRDAEFVSGSGTNSFFLVPINKDGAIVDGTKVQLTTEEGFEVTGYLMKKMMSEDPQMQKMLKDAGKK